jgi:hypothetical protein
MSSHGVMAEVTVCAACGKSLDYRPLRDVDLAGSEDEMPAYESEIQAKARAAKAAEVLAESEAQAAGAEGPPGTEGPPAATVEDVDLLMDLGPHEETVKRNRNAHEAVLCEKHGGEIEPCDNGERRANFCHHSKWGRLGTFNAPCPCTGCHAP